MSGNQMHAGFWRVLEDGCSPRGTRAGRAPRRPRRFAAPAWFGDAAVREPRRDPRPLWQLAVPTAWRFLLALHDRIVQARRRPLQRH